MTVVVEDEREEVIGGVRRDGLVGVVGAGWLERLVEEVVELVDTEL